jgi:aldehyde:ferredoxin oxidoreductase
VKILIVDLAKQIVTERPLDDPLAGGRLLTAQLATEFIDPHAEPLGAGNALILASGALAGLPVSTSGRLSIGGKSPLTRGIKESNAGGMAGDTIAHLGYRAIVFTNTLADPGLFILDEQGARFADARAYLGLGNEATAQALAQDFGDEYVIVSIGQAGERMCKASAIAVTDAQGKPFRMAARGGMGAVMGSKKLKAILLHRPNKRNTFTRETQATLVAFNKHVANSDRIKVLRDYGTASTVAMVQAMGGMVVNNFSRGQHTNATAIGGEQLRDTILARGGVGTPTEACMRGCVIQCSNIFADANGKLSVAPLEFETIGLCGANLGLESLDDIAKINRLCNDLGLDTIEVGAALGVMMEAGETGNVPEAYAHERLPRFGDGVRAAELVAEIAQDTPLGKLLGDGAVATGAALGIEHVPAVKGQAMSAYDPRVVKGTGVTYATSPQGADHTAGLTVFFRVDHLDPKLAVSLSRASQIQRAAYDALGLCVFNTSATGQQPEFVVNMMRAVYGIELPDNWLDDLGRRVIEIEIAFNRAAGFTNADDRLPEFFTREPLSPTNSTFDVSPDALDHIWDK